MRSFTFAMWLVAGATAGLAAAPTASAQDQTNPPEATPPPADFSSAPPTQGYPPSVVARDTGAYEVQYEDPGMKGRVSGFFAYNFGIPLGSVRDFTANVSPVGLELQFRGWVTDRISLGLAGEWGSYVDERSRETFEIDNAAVTATVYNRMMMTNGHFLVQYYLGEGSVLPYIGPHVGIGWTWFETEAADLAISDTEFSWNFGGEIGVLFGEEPVVMANARYTWYPDAEFIGTVDSVQTLSLLIGVGM